MPTTARSCRSRQRPPEAARSSQMYPERHPEVARGSRRHPKAAQRRQKPRRKLPGSGQEPPRAAARNLRSYPGGGNDNCAATARSKILKRSIAGNSTLCFFNECKALFKNCRAPVCNDAKWFSRALTPILNNMEMCFRRSSFLFLFMIPV